MTNSKPYYSDDLVTLWHGDCVEVMRGLPEASVDAVVTDPPYGLEFMGKDWDSFAPSNMIKRSGWDTAASSARIDTDDGSPHGRVAFHKRRSTYRCRECGKRDGFRNKHACGNAWEAEWVDAEPVEALAFGEWSRQWATEALRVLKPGGHLLAFGGTRTWHRLAVAIEDAGLEVRDSIAWMYGSGFPKSLDVSKAIDKAAGAERPREMKFGAIAPGSNNYGGNAKGGAWVMAQTDEAQTDAAQQWQGWGTALKPAFEPIVVARKPLIGTVAENVLAHGTGALNIDGCRIGTDGGTAGATAGPSDGIYGNGLNGEFSKPVPGLGRWPANVILDESQAAELDRQSGVTSSPTTSITYTRSTDGTKYAGPYKVGDEVAFDNYGDTGGASRFFYVPKANSSERPRDGEVAHPTVKPLELMRYLVKLVTPPGGTVLEPFAGSGTTLEACVVEGFNVIGIELTEEYLPLITQRITKPTQQVLL